MRLVLYVDQFPAVSETFVVQELEALRRLGHPVRVEAGGWAEPAAPLPEHVGVTCLADDPLARRALDVAWLFCRAPSGCLADLWERRRWKREEAVHPLRVLAPMARRMARLGERHVHVHFAGTAALDALRLARLVGVTYSVTAHAFDIYRAPANLGAKIAGAAVAAGVCRPAVADLRRAAGPEHARHVHLIAMGVDAERFARRRPRTAGRHVLAVGRLVEKKGFGHLIEAAARLRDQGHPLERVTIVGDGPLRAALERKVADLSLEGTVVLAGARPHDEVRDSLEDADLLVMPSVVAGDGDRDALPVVVLEALAMEVPVVATEVSGLPEVVRPPWGRLVPPADAAGLAGAMGDVLARPAEERAEMGRAGRAFVVAERDPLQWAGRLLELLAAAGVR